MTEEFEGSESQANENGEPNAASGEQGEPERWFWSENVPGEGPRPDFLPEKFKSVADAAKARGELEKKLGAFTGAPEEYKVDHLELDPEQHTLKEIMGLSKELNMSQDGFDKLVGKLMNAQEAENTVSLEDEVAALGEEGPRLMRQYKNFRDNHLQPEEQELVKGWIKSADDLKAFNDLVKGVYAKRLPTDNGMYLANSNETKETIQAEMTKNLERYRNDSVYRQDIRNRLDFIEKKERRAQGV